MEIPISDWVEQVVKLFKHEHPRFFLKLYGGDNEGVNKGSFASVTAGDPPKVGELIFHEDSKIYRVAGVLNIVKNGQLIPLLLCRLSTDEAVKEMLYEVSFDVVFHDQDGVELEHRSFRGEQAPQPNTLLAHNDKVYRVREHIYVAHKYTTVLVILAFLEGNGSSSIPKSNRTLAKPDSSARFVGTKGCETWKRPANQSGGSISYPSYADPRCAHSFPPSITRE